VDDLRAALERVSASGGAAVHPGEMWAICRDSEGSPFALAQNTDGALDAPSPPADHESSQAGRGGQGTVADDALTETAAMMRRPRKRWSGRVKLDDEFLDIGPLDAIRVAPATARAFEAGPDGLEFLAFGPRHAGDGQQVEDPWTDLEAAARRE
jgi:hypothetical protein